MGIILSDELRQKVDFYEKYYFSLDTPTPFRKDIKVYPVLVKDYYKFYSLLPCLTMNKNVKKALVKEEVNGQEVEIEKEVSNPMGMQMSYMAYLCEMMRDETYGPSLTSQVTNLMEMVLHIKNGLYCPNCHSEKADICFQAIIENLQKCETDEERQEYWRSIAICPDCGEQTREVYTIKDNGRIKKFCIGDYECSPKDFEELIAIITHLNILQYDDDIYIDPELKKDLDLKKKLQNKDFTSPTLEKQLVVVALNWGKSLEEVKNLPIRKLSFMLKMIDSQMNYQMMKTASMSGFVTFKGEIPHYLYSDDNFGRDLSKEIMSVDQLKKKMESVV